MGPAGWQDLLKTKFDEKVLLWIQETNLVLESGGFKYFKLMYYAATQLRCQDECDDEKVWWGCK